MNRVVRFFSWAYYRFKAICRFKRISSCNTPKEYAQCLSSYVGKKLLTADEVNALIIEKIESGKPFLAGRFGSTELLNMQSFEFGVHGKHGLDDRFKQLCEWSGFFPRDISLLGQFVNIMKESIKDVDVLACWFHPFEDYYIKKMMKESLQLTYLLDMEPWCGAVHWSSALEGKKVLIIHPFTEDIEAQYDRYTDIFPFTDILPKFTLKTLKAVQTLAGTEDNRFATWYDALDWMYIEAIKIDFDIAIIGCGAYGLPLAAKLKKVGKQAIHLAGATQILFGIKGKRWDEGEAFAYIRNYYNDAWIYPGERNRIKNSNEVEDGCYW